MTPPENDPVTIGELYRNIRAMELRINGQFEAVNHRLDSLSFVSQEAYRIEIEGVKERIDDLEEDSKWKSRALLASFVFPLLVGVLVMVIVSAVVS